MATLTISTIQGKPDLATSNSAGVVLQPDVSATIWDVTGYFVDGDGSTKPVTFQTPEVSDQPYAPALVVNALVLFTSAYSGGTFSVEGYIMMDGAIELNVLQSLNHVAPPSSSPTPVPLSFSNWRFHPDLRLLPNCPVPFRIAGDFRWRLKFEKLPMIVGVQSTRLEICYARSEASSGPSATNNPLIRQTRVDLNGIYPIRLLRMFLPAPVQFRDMPNFNQSSVYGPWYAHRLMDQIWAWGNPQPPRNPQYNALNGASSYNLSGIGGGFEFQRWYMRASAYCNCYDLAGIAQLGCCLLLDSMGNELFDSHWLFQSPNGYIKQCVLYGWGVDFPYDPPKGQPGVNNPFFLSSGTAYVAPGGVGRQPFGNHAWVEILTDPNNGNTRGVLDATTAAPNAAGICHPDYGNRSRVAYKDAHIDAAGHAAATGNLEAYIEGGISNGDCYLNYTYYTNVVGAPGQKGRVGVWNADGIDPPWLLADLILTTVKGIGPEIEALLRKGQNPQALPSTFNNATVSTGLQECVLNAVPSLNLSSSETNTIESLTLLRLTFEGASYAESISAQLIIKVHVYDSFRYARSALIKDLLSYAGPGNLSEHLKALATPIAETALIDNTGQHLHFVHGNCYIHMSLDPDRAAAPGASLLDLEPIAQRLYEFLAADSLPPGQEGRPALEIGTPDSPDLHVGKAIVLTANGDYATLKGSSSDGSVVICAGLRDGMSNAVEFFAIGKGEAELSLHVADKRTLFPNTKKWKVNVE